MYGEGWQGVEADHEQAGQSADAAAQRHVHEQDCGLLHQDA